MLPFFNEETKIVDCKELICNSLLEYNKKIEKLREDIYGFNLNSSKLK